MSDPTAPPGAPYEVGLVVRRVANVYRLLRGAGADIMPMLLVADDRDAPPTFVPFVDTPDADARATVLWAAVALWPERGAPRVLFASDAFVRTADVADIDLAVAPADDPLASEALQLIYATRDDPRGEPRLWLAAFAYVVDEHGFRWREGAKWLPTENHLSPMQLAVMAATVGDEELFAAVHRH